MARPKITDDELKQLVKLLTKFEKWYWPGEYSGSSEQSDVGTVRAIARDCIGRIAEVEQEF